LIALLLFVVLHRIGVVLGVVDEEAQRFVGVVTEAGALIGAVYWTGDWVIRSRRSRRLPT